MCVILGCLNRRVGANECARHGRMSEQMSSAGEDRLSDADYEDLARQRVAEERAAKVRARDEQREAKAEAYAESADELAIRLLLLSSLEGAVAESFSRAKELLAGRMTLGDMKRPQIAGRAAGSVTYANGSTYVTVTDPAALTAWVEEHYTTELELVTSVRPAFLTAILEATKAAGEPCAPDGTLGVPGLSVRSGAPRIVVRPDKARAADLWLEARANPLRLITSQEPT